MDEPTTTQTVTENDALWHFLKVIEGGGVWAEPYPAVAEKACREGLISAPVGARFPADPPKLTERGLAWMSLHRPT